MDSESVLVLLVIAVVGAVLVTAILPILPCIVRSGGQCLGLFVLFFIVLLLFVANPVVGIGVGIIVILWLVRRK